MDFLHVIRPVSAPVSSRFGRRTLRGKPSIHYGVDYGVPIGTPVRAPISGRVVFSGSAGSLGLAVTIQSGAIAVVVGHLFRVLVREGKYVNSGETVGLSGNTGNSTAPHVHVAIYDGKYYYDFEKIASSK